MYGEGELEVSEGWRQIRDLSTTTDPNISSAVHDEDHFCKLLLYKEIKDSRVRIWDVIILIPNLLFLLFIVVRFNRARLKLRATSSPIYLAFYGLVICSVVISIIRCVVSMTVNAAASIGGKADKVLWVTVRFFLLSTEMSVVIFGLAFGNLDSRSSIRRVLLATSFIALVFTITQGTLELVLPDDTFHIPSRDFYVFGHGGMMFWFCSSIVFTTIYLFLLVVPYTRIRERLTLPNRKGFYVYASLLATLDLVQSIGAGLLNYTQNPAGLCVVDLTAAMYLTLFTPVVYHTFLSDFLGVSQPSIMFSYKAQVDDAMDEDTVSLPHQQSFSSLKTDSDYIYQVHTPCFHVPFFHSQCLMRIPPAGTSRLTNSSSHATFLCHDRPARSHLQSRLNMQSSAPDLRLTGSLSIGRRVQKEDLDRRLRSNPLLSPSTASKFIFKQESIERKTNLFSPDTTQSYKKSSNIDSGTLLIRPQATTSTGSTTGSPKIESSLQSILDSCDSPEEKTEEKKNTASLSKYLRHIRSRSIDEGDDNDVEVKMLPQKSRESSSDSSSVSQSEAL